LEPPANPARFNVLDTGKAARTAANGKIAAGAEYEPVEPVRCIGIVLAHAVIYEHRQP
jgi:hypothetical protein